MTISTDRAACEAIVSQLRDRDPRYLVRSLEAESAALILALLEERDEAMAQRARAIKRAEKAEADNVALREDAERYRYIRSKSATVEAMFACGQSRRYPQNNVHEHQFLCHRAHRC